MAMDEALLDAMPRLGRPVLRFYGWTERAASFGTSNGTSGVGAVCIPTLRSIGAAPHRRGDCAA